MILFFYFQWQDYSNYGNQPHPPSGQPGSQVREIPIIHQNTSSNFPQTSNQQYGQHGGQQAGQGLDWGEGGGIRQIPIVREGGAPQDQPHGQYGSNHHNHQQPRTYNHRPGTVNQQNYNNNQQSYSEPPQSRSQPPHMNPGQQSSRSSSGSPTVRDIPIVRENNVPRNNIQSGPNIYPAPPSGSTSNAPPSAPYVPPPQSAVNPDVKRVYSASPVIDRLKTSDQNSERRSPSPAPAHLTPLEHIAEIQSEADKTRREVETFTGVKTDKSYRYLEEMLTRLLIKLDRIDSNGQQDIREARRNAVRSVQATCDQLELKVMSNMMCDSEAQVQAQVRDLTLDSEQGC